MIKLELLDACQNCPDLDPIKTNSVDLMCMGEVIERNCTITCSDINKCKALLDYVRREELRNV